MNHPDFLDEDQTNELSVLDRDRMVEAVLLYAVGGNIRPPGAYLRRVQRRMFGSVPFDRLAFRPDAVFRVSNTDGCLVDYMGIVLWPTSEACKPAAPVPLEMFLICRVPETPGAPQYQDGSQGYLALALGRLMGGMRLALPAGAEVVGIARTTRDKIEPGERSFVLLYHQDGTLWLRDSEVFDREHRVPTAADLGLN